MTALRAAVCGSPIRHSLSPVLHRAAYRALGLTDWTYDRVELSADALAPWVSGLDETWRGLSLTMPLKEAAFAVAGEVSDLARTVGSINTLVRASHGWDADNTDVVGIARALAEAGVSLPRHALVVGAGATARSALAALAGLGVTGVTVMVRTEIRSETADVAARLGLALTPTAVGAWPEVVDVVIGTVPPEGYAGALAGLPDAAAPAAGSAAILDCVYGDGPSPLLAAAVERGYAAVPGTEMLLHQAAEQVHLMTGHVAPVRAMRAALRDALSGG